ncbi:RES domain-containing protein (plasmid) [Legionella adelaidensis]|uniref:RES domain-containing protein n=1 Tax=Legionella adelaidensis TaxID=45056 RepID=A0A0W0R5M6_9GAMM|nr:RES family NAD+ phosphorylase [Legionella adelaidensis]KTC66327.1 RES domain-containing protein [Legionella adelaidensis]VEH84925.1 RES domain-containing protein [Legionella adelaidensis]
MHSFANFNQKVHRLIPSKFPPISLFDWASSAQELEQIAFLEGLTNERIQAELGRINLVDKDDWVGGPGSTPLMAAFTHIGAPTRFSDGTYGIYYAGSTLVTAIKETIFHRERFYSASKEANCSISMREYIAEVKQPLVDITLNHKHLLEPNPVFYTQSQEFGKKIREEKHWGILYPSVRHDEGLCVAIFRPPALTTPVQGCHLTYIWDGARISEVYRKNKINLSVAPQKRSCVYDT